MEGRAGLGLLHHMVPCLAIASEQAFSEVVGFVGLDFDAWCAVWIRVEMD